ncbi:M81 family metallopeptidase [Pseudohoeflea coraliihabitans]|uniref:Microcystinase C n=1 Tax=Pseudohoeflea coraliihabitans TaxID=2860393 RepID=A0ABS6WIB0_9HYPH|nr:M81 family metallopeptidase [Pseudohoeflea sp. DP4N28-3]MBW3095693.1 M81 family metallopeptidase [Pseudohoeflea sp. DP4N28-3]
MKTVLIVECMQEISSFNPVPSEYENFEIEQGEALFAHRGGNTAIGGALQILNADAGIRVMPGIAARAGSAGLLSEQGWRRLSQQLLEAVRAKIDAVDAIYVSLHGAMGASGELDPEGFLLSEIRAMAGPDTPIVISLDLHGILTEKMIKAIDGLAIYHTYPHVDFADTGARAARLLLRLMAGGPPAAIARAVIPALVRGDELITRTGCYGDLIRECQRLEAEGSALSAGVMIGNPFTDVPEVCSQVIISTDGDGKTAQREAERLAAEFWAMRHRMQSRLVPLERAIGQARTLKGTVCFTDAADATSSGASGDSNVILQALREAKYPKRVLAQIVDPAAAAAAHQAGVGATLSLTLGGGMDAERYRPMPVTARVKLLSDGRARLETMGLPLDAGATAVLAFEQFTVVVMSRTVSLFDRAMYFACGLNPADFDLVVVKSPHTEYHMYDGWVAANFNIDAPGATSANIAQLGHRICARPMFPLDAIHEFVPRATLHRRG